MARRYTRKFRQYLRKTMSSEEHGHSGMPTDELIRDLNESHREELKSFGYERVGQRGVQELRQKLKKRSTTPETSYDAVLSEPDQAYKSQLQIPSFTPSQDPDETLKNLEAYRRMVIEKQRHGDLGLARTVYGEYAKKRVGEYLGGLLENLESALEAETVPALREKVGALLTNIPVEPEEKQIIEKKPEGRNPIYLQMLEASDRILDRGEMPYASAIATEVALKGIESRHVSVYLAKPIREGLVERKFLPT